MKFKAQFPKSLLTKFIVNASLLTTACTYSFASAAQEEVAERWFEIEVILFTQLGDKSKLKEQFSTDISAANLPKYKQAYDLLTPYLQPNLTAIKQFIPLCSNKNGESHFSLAQKKLTIALPEQTLFIQQANDFTYEPIVFSLATDEEALLSTNNYFKAKETENEPSIQSTANAEIPAQEKASTEQPSAQLDDALIFDWQTAALNSALFSTNQLCVYRQTDFEEILDEQQLASFSLDGFAVETLSKKLNASGAHIQNSPYLIADDALLLKDINTRLRWSKVFKPLLHFGWRQVGVTRTRAVPMKVFAGQHVENDYQQALIENQKQTQLHLEELQASEGLTSEHGLDTSDELLSTQLQQEEVNKQAEARYYAQLKQQVLAKLFADIDTLTDNDKKETIIEETIEQVSKQTLDDMLAINENTRTVSKQLLDIIPPPIKPLQPWFLDGFFKVHLDHYLYITADFNLLNNADTQSKSRQSDTEQAAMKLINFSQNRRVITGEVHYFDHPYMGMVVQIRRFDPTKPKDEAVSQAVR
ncbi:MAG: peptidoglycan binding protein CsiV [Colwellia sp.]|nr:peptidoglycan binding protein CsiV [Colwellia sp.]MCW8863457.1 peptidoglycan binding protein CsiV [Colwellia sp.]MCW9082846.1 peptidoglycan binding protein CsiV [Colwellia sp.]